MIAGKTDFEILKMPGSTRSGWYKRILPKEKEEAMKIVEAAKQNRHSKFMIEQWKDPEYRDSHSGENNANYNKIFSEEDKNKVRNAWTLEKRDEMSKRVSGKNNPMYGNIHSKETRAKISVSQTGKTLTEEHKAKIGLASIELWKDPEYRDKLSGENSAQKRPEIRAEVSMRTKGEKNPNFNNWASREPYCHLWNEPLREEVRNRWGRVCVLTDLMRSTLGSESGLDDFEGHEIFSSRRFAVHHIKGDKMAGCNGKELALISIQNKFNTKKFDGIRLEENPFYITLFLLKDIERKHREEMLR